MRDPVDQSMVVRSPFTQSIKIVDWFLIFSQKIDHKVMGDLVDQPMAVRLPFTHSFPRTVILWNQLPQTAVSQTTLEAFQNQLANHTFYMQHLVFNGLTITVYIPLLSVAHGHPPPHCENTQVLREAITEDDDGDTEHKTLSNGSYFFRR